MNYIVNTNNIELIRVADVYNILGEKITSYDYENTSKAEIQLYQQPEGIYFVHILTDKNNYVIKFLKYN